MHTYDQFGWYSGEADPGRDAGIAPENTSTDTTVGELRANWDGAAWVDLPYAVPTAPPVRLPCPHSVTMRQARLALLGVGLLDDVETAIAAMSEPAKSAALIEWNVSNELLRGNPLVAALGPALGLSDAQVDALFIAAAAL